jgi:glycosyltransferase involved in cell wall biosynthesis
MKVLVLSSLYPNNVWNHHGVFVEERMVHFAKHCGASIKVVAPVPYYPAIRIGSRAKYAQVIRVEQRHGVEVIHPRYFMIPKIAMVLHGWFMYRALLPMVKRMRQVFDFDVIDGHFLYPDGFAAVLLGRSLKKPVVVTARGSDINRYRHFPVVRRLLCHALDRAQAIVAVSHALKAAMTELGVPPEKITVVPNGVDRHKFYPMPKREARRLLGVPEDGSLVLFVGNLTENKGCDLIIRAVKFLHNRSSPSGLALAVVGDGPFRSHLERLVAALDLRAHVNLVGDVPHRELAPWYSAADVFCLASEKEGWPNVILESLACGTPVVATAVGGVPEIISCDEVGMLTERNDSAIAHQLAEALGRRWDKEAIVRHAEQYSWDRTSRALSEVFRQACAHQSAGTGPLIVSNA